MSDIRESFSSPLPIVALLLIAAGLIAPQVLLQSPRPDESERLRPVVPAASVPSRLWQDPLAAIELAREAKGDSADALRRRGDEANLASIRKNAARLLAATPGRASDARLLILPVLLVATPFPDDAEMRRRVRYAVISGLRQSGFTPVDSERIDFVSWCPREVRARPAPAAAAFLATPTCDAADLVRLPHEWFVQTDERDPNGANRWLRKAGEQRVAMVLWLREEDFYESPLELLQALAARVAPDGEASLAPVRVVGPATSSLYVTLLGALDPVLPKDGETPAGVDPKLAAFVADRLRFYSYGATIPGAASVREAVGERRAQDWKPQSVVRVVGGDDALVTALVAELGLRGVDNERFLSGGPPGVCPDEVVLIVEGDYTYGRNLGRELEQRVLERCLPSHRAEGGPVYTFTYFRGLDGVLPLSGAKDDRPASRADAGRGRSASIEDGPREHAEGRNQYDYLRRLADRIAVINAEGGTERRVRAIGIFGSDVYDKLLILQALQSRIQDVVFFTTDLDARFLHHDQSGWARNLVVASHFGLELHPAIQGDTPAFRDGYQTAAYLATQLASGALAGAEAAQVETLRGAPRVFEIGRTRAVDVIAGEIGSCEWPKRCASVHAPQISEVGHVTGRHWLAILALGTLVVLLTTRANRVIARAVHLPELDPPHRRQFLLWTAFAAGCALVVVAIVAVVAQRIGIERAAGSGEPFIWLEGVSAWPSHFVRFVALLAAVVLAAIGLTHLRRRAREITIAFGLQRVAASRGRVRRASDGPAPTRAEKWQHRLDWLRGPFADFARTERRQVLGSVDERVSVDRLWQRYLDRTSGAYFWSWIALATALFGVFAYSLYRLDPPFFPHRGAVVARVNELLWVANVLLLWATIFWTVYEARACAYLVDRLATTRSSSWPATIVERRSAESGVPQPLVLEWLDFDLIVRAADRVNPIVYVPFVQIFLLGLAFHPMFDSADVPFPLIVIAALSLVYVIYAMLVLRRAAERAKSLALARYGADLLWLQGGSKTAEPSGYAKTRAPDGGPAHAPLALTQLDDAQRRAAPSQIGTLVDRIRGTREGPFLPLLQQPFLKATLIPFSGWSGVSLIEPLLNYFGL